jgi:hypothetical protein
MSHVQGTKSVDPKTHFQAGMKDFFRFDQVRFINIVGSIQYGMMYCVFYLFVGMFLHYLFPPFLETDPLWNIFLWILLQSIVIIIVTFYSQKLIESIPGILSFFPQYFDLTSLLDKGFKPYGISEYKGEMASAIVLIGTQFRLLEKIAFFTLEFTKRYLS